MEKGTTSLEELEVCKAYLGIEKKILKDGAY